MAPGEHVKRAWVHAAAVAVVIALTAAGCSGADAPPVETRGRVIDQDTGEGIAGAIVVAKYMGGISLGGSSCNRVESAVSDAEGWFYIPPDPKAGPTLMEAYHRDYVYGKSTRRAGLDIDRREWRVEIHKWPPEGGTSIFLGYDPRVFRTEKDAIDASGEQRDAYLRRFKGTREERLRELHRISITCAGGPRTSPGLVPFLEAVLKEQEELGDTAEALRDSRQGITWAKNQQGSGDVRQPK
jgi:hypothetical protein